MLARIRAARARRYAVNYFSYLNAAASTPCAGGRVFRTRRAAEAEALRLASLDTRDGLYSVAQVA